MSIPLLSLGDLTARWDSFRRPWQDNYLAMFSTVWGGIVTDPLLMTIPMDDHLVHRGDGVFDVFKCVNGKAYSLKPHLERLVRSAQGIQLDLPKEFDDLTEIIKATVRAGGEPDVLVRMVISRGPGGFSTDPYECPARQLFVTVIRLKRPAADYYERGVTIISTPVPVKPPPFASFKSCDYVSNVLVKKAAMDAGTHFAVTWDHEGYLAEGSVENVLIVSAEGVLMVPSFERVLKGVTVSRVMDLAEGLVGEGLLKGVENTHIDRETAAGAREVMLCGTTLDVVPVVRWDGREIGEGTPGPAARRLLEVLRADIAGNPDLQTPMFED